MIDSLMVEMQSNVIMQWASGQTTDLCIIIYLVLLFLCIGYYIYSYTLYIYSLVYMWIKK